MKAHQWIEDLLEVLTNIQRLRNQRGPLPVAELRLEAARLVAKRRRRDNSTIANAYHRALGGDTEAFDQDVEAWLSGQPAKLSERMLARAQNEIDRQRIDAFFRYPVTLVTVDEQLPIPGLPPGKPRRASRSAKARRPVSVVLDSDVAKVFPDDEAVNSALRLLIRAARKAKPRTP